MNRAERRRQVREEKRKTTTYNLTEEQLNAMVRERVNRSISGVKQEITDEAINTAMILLLTLPMKVLMDHYWTKTAHKRIPEFTEHVLDYYEKWQNGEIDITDLQNDLWEYGGIKLMEGDY